MFKQSLFFSSCALASSLLFGAELSTQQEGQVSANAQVSTQHLAISSSSGGSGISNIAHGSNASDVQATGTSESTFNSAGSSELNTVQGSTLNAIGNIGNQLQPGKASTDKAIGAPVSNPGVISAVDADAISETNSVVGNQLKAGLTNDLDAELLTNSAAQIQKNTSVIAGEQVESAMGTAIARNVSSTVVSAATANVLNELTSQASSDVEATVSSQISEQVSSAVEAATMESISSSITNATGLGL